MSHTPRRTLLRTAGVAALAGVTGCLFGSDDGGTTTEPGRRYSVVVRNRIAGDVLETANRPPDAPANVTLEAARSVDGEEDPVLFERSLDIAPLESRTFPDAFATEPGETYVVRALADRYRRFGDERLRAQLRFSPGEFNTPDDDTVEVELFNKGGSGVLVGGLRFASETTTARGIRRGP